MSNVPHVNRTPEEEIKLSIFHIIIWCIPLIVGIVAIIRGEITIIPFLFILALCYFEIYLVGIRTYIEAKEKIKKRQGKDNNGKT